MTERLEHPDKKVRSIRVADRNTRALIDATTAFWVIGGRKRGVMTMRATWAFAKKGDAEAFIKNYGGALATWQEALEAARQDHTPPSRTR